MNTFCVGRPYDTSPWLAASARVDLPVFVYGTLMHGQSNHPVLAAGEISRRLPARTVGRLYDSGLGYPGMLPCAPGEPVTWVQGELVFLERFAQALPALDELEEFQGFGRHDNMYERRIVPVDCDDGFTRMAWTYVVVAPEVCREPIASGCWRTHPQRHQEP